MTIKRLSKGVALGLAPLLLVSASGPIKVGMVAPPFELTLMDGSKVSLVDLRGQVVVLNFWATWCVPCKQELPLLDRYYELQKAHGLRVFAITTEDSLQPFQLKKLFAVMHISADPPDQGQLRCAWGCPDELHHRSVGSDSVCEGGGVRSRYVEQGIGATAAGKRSARTDELGHASRAATPGRSLPSIHSRKAPPAVDTKVKSSPRPLD